MEAFVRLPTNVTATVVADNDKQHVASNGFRTQLQEGLIALQWVPTVASQKRSRALHLLWSCPRKSEQNLC